MKAYLKLRANIELDGDLKIAERELSFFCTLHKIITRANISEFLQQDSVFDKSIIISNSRKNNVLGYYVSINENSLLDLIKRSSFFQEIWIPPSSLILQSMKNSKYYFNTKKGFHFILPLFPAAEFLTFYKKEIDINTLDIFIRYLANEYSDNNVKKAVNKSLTSTLHVHGLHKYKAKFFPRLVRSLLVTEGSNYNAPRVLDPFVGSGTTLVESSLLGYNSVGIDIDKLSCLISQNKVNLLKTKSIDVKKQSIEFYQQNGSTNSLFLFPSWIAKKFERWSTEEEKKTYESQISKFVKAASNLKEHSDLFKIIISDALSRKFNIRMMGTGVGRFAMEIQKTSLQNLVDRNILNVERSCHVLEIINDIYNVKYGNSIVEEGDATKLNYDNSVYDLILTSPPYLPASSGRENYLIGKSISIRALDLLSEKEIKEKESGSVGNMITFDNYIHNGLPQKVYDLYNFLLNDDLRKIKAYPIYNYYKEIKKSLEESYRVLKEGGKAIFVIGKSSVFYRMKTKEILYTVECDNIFEEIAHNVGFTIKEKIDLELNKKNKNARPRSIDSYFETVFIMQK